MHSAFLWFDDLSSKNLDAYVRTLVKLLKKEEGESNVERIGAAKELNRQFNQPSRIVAQTQKMKWTGLADETKCHVKSTVS